MPQHEAFRQARIQLQRAQRSLDAMGTAQNFEDTNAHWENFLSLVDRAFNRLISAKSDKGKINEKIGKIVHARRRDELLKYLMEARNTNEHTLSPVAGRRERGGFIGVVTDPEKGAYIKSLRIVNGKIVQNDSTGMTMQEVHPGLTLLGVKDRSGNYHRPPVVHLGQEILLLTPLNVGELALKFYNDQLDELERL